MATVISGEATLYYEVHGEGPCVVLAHGAAGNAASWWQQVPVLREHFQVVVFDHRGFGRSSCVDDAISAVHFESDLVAILDREGIDRAAIVGQSMGGWTCVRLACRHPDRVSCVVLANTPGAVLTDALVHNAAASKKARDNGLAEAAISAEFSARAPALAYLYQQLAAYNRPSPKVGAGAIGIDSFATAEELAGYRHPTLMITSDLDTIFPASVIRATAPLLHAEVVEIEGAGHSTYFEKPEEFNREVLRFLEAHVPAGS